MKRTLQLIFSILIITNSLYAQTPVITSFSPGKGPVGSLITVNGVNLAGATSIKIGSVSALPISNDGSKLVFMIMPGTITGKISITTISGAVTSVSNINIIPHNIPNKQLGQKLTSIFPGVSFGSSIALSADGKTVAIGASSTAVEDKGGIYIYVLQNGAWVQQGPMLLGTGVKNYAAAQGTSVAISADGNTVMEGGINDNNYTGAVWVFVRDKDGNWSQQGNKLVATGLVGPYLIYFGIAVALSADGNTAIIGADENNNSEGGAWIFTRDTNGVWSQQGNKLLGTAGWSFSTEGGAVAMSADGETAVIGSSEGNAFWIFTKNVSGTWQQNGSYYQGSGVANNLYSEQGRSIAISADGNTIVEGGNQDSSGYGAVWVFTRNQSGNWVQQGNKLTVNSIGKAAFGSSVSINAEGNMIVAGGSGNNNNTGASWIFTRNANGEWSQYGNKLVGYDSSYSNQGNLISQSADGSIIMVGGYKAVWTFADSAAVLPVSITDIKAYPFAKGIQIEWNGYNEINLTGYDIEKSANAISFNKVNYTPSHNSGDVSNNYKWLDASPVADDNFYRIKAIGKDGSVQYSPVVKVNIGSISSSIKVSPNPVNTNVINTQLTNVQAGKYIINLYTLNGKKITTTSYSHLGGSAVVSLITDKLAAGVYIVEVKGNKYNYMSKVIVE